MVERLEDALRLLGIPAHSTPEHVAEAYRRLARVTHPDVSTDPDAAARFATLTSAYRLASATARSEHAANHPERRGGLRPPPPNEPAAAGWASPHRPPIVAGPVTVRRSMMERGDS